MSARSNKLTEHLAFLKRLASSPRDVGAIAPSSRFLAQKMVQSLDLPPDARVVEFGPGTGPFTEVLLELLGEDGSYLGVERDPEFFAHLKARFPEADIVEGSVEDLLEFMQARGWDQIDAILSGLPFASLPQDVTETILRSSYQALKPGGSFTTFQYVHSVPLPSARKFRQWMHEAFGPLEARQIEWRNLPPAFVFTWHRREGEPSW